MSHREIRALSVKDMAEYILAIEKLEAHETLLSIQASSYPHMKKEDQDKAYRRLINTAELEKREMDSAEIAKLLGFV